jgi:hypothetical protein
MNLILISLSISFPLWLLNLQFNPKIGNVWIRPDETGERVFCYKSIINVLKEPFINWYFWKPCNWDINFYTFFGITYLIIYLLNKI